jgi:NTE family protein
MNKPAGYGCGLLICLLVAAAWAVPLRAQERQGRPRIGLVLSGGGARGLAHIGMLQWMEENHIPVDFIAGTSMGGLVGAMYATGSSPAEMRNFMLQIDWDDVLSIEPSYRQLSYRRKQDRRAFQVGVPLGIKNGLSGPNGFNPGQGVTLLIDRVVFPYSTIQSFDELPIPFRCVATDMLEGEQVVFHDGALGTALRATMAIPGVFTPVEYRHTLLADGGLLNNIPTDVARSMGADRVIAINVGTPLGDRKNLETLGGILEQTIGVMTIERDRRSLKAADVVITPDLGATSNLDFYDPDKIINLGYQAGVKAADKLRPYALPQDEWEKYTAERSARMRRPNRTVAAVEVSGVQGSELERLRRRLRSFQGPNLDTRRLAQQLTRIAGEGRFDSLGYEGFITPGGQGLRIRAHEKTYGPPFLDVALNVQGSGIGSFDFVGGLRITAMDVGRHGGEWRSDILLGSSDFLATEFYQPLGTSKVFVAPFGFFQKRALDGFLDDKRVAQFRDRRAGGGVDFGLASGRRSEVRVGYQIFHGDISPLIGSAGLPTLDGTSGDVHLRAVYDDQDSAIVPSSGERVTAEITHVFHAPGVTQSFNQMQIQSSTFVPLSRRGSLFLNTSGGTTFSRDAGTFQVFSLGGPFRLGAYGRDEFLGNHYAYASLGYRRELLRLPVLLGKKVYWGGWYEIGTAFHDPDTVVARHSFNAGVIAETILGPIALTGAVSPAGRTKINFTIGRLF